MEGVNYGRADKQQVKKYARNSLRENKVVEITQDSLSDY
jgi:hypothetical protein